MNVTDTQALEPTPRLSASDIVFVLARHKWTILLLTFLGLAAAAALFKMWPKTVYRSEAKLFIRYLQESKAPASVGDDARVVSPDQRGETIIGSELEILTSMDLAKVVASKVGAERILRSTQGGNNLDAAAAMVQAGLTAQAPRGSRVVRLTFAHPDSEIVQPVLNVLVDEYLRRHVEIHQTAGMYDELLSKETVLLRSRLAQTEEELRKAKEKAGVVTLDESKRAYAEQMSKVRQQIFDAMAELAERRAIQEQFNVPKDTGVKAPADKAREHRNAAALLEALNKQEQDLLFSYHPDTPAVTNVRKRIAEAEETKARLEKQFPSLATQSPMVRARSGDNGTTPEMDERTAIRVLETRIAVLEKHLERLRNEAAELSGLELSITDLQRKKDLQEQHYKYFSASLEQSRINEALSSGRVSNISVIESPTPAVSDVGKKNKVVAAVASSGLLLGLALAFGLEMFVDRSIKRPREIRDVVGMPLFLSIPRLSMRLLSAPAREMKALPAPSPLDRSPQKADPRESTDLPDLPNVPHSPLWAEEHPLHPYFESLRNQVVHEFDVRKLVHKPKLVGVTSCDRAAGVSTVAAGLAASLSRTGEGNVLLVDMNPNDGNQRYFKNGDLKLDVTDAIENQQRNGGQIEDHLFVASAANGAPMLPRRFSALVPKMKASDFDYIIFDMPPVHQLTATAHFARHMDAMLVVVEAEKTNRDAVAQVAEILQNACDSVGVVLNKTRSYLPRGMLQEA